MTDVKYVYDWINPFDSIKNFCKNEVKLSPCSWNVTTEDIISSWNSENDPQILREKYQKQIDELQKLIDNLPTQHGEKLG